MDDKIILAGTPSELRTQISLIFGLKESGLLSGRIALASGINNYAPKRKLRPKITVYFEEQQTVGNDKRLTHGELSMRIMNRTHKTVSLQDIKLWSERIESKFAKPPFIWQKGKRMFSYTDWDMGYQFQLLCDEMSEAKRIIEQALDIQGHTPEWMYLNMNTNAEEAQRYSEVAEKETILGALRELPKLRPRVKVRYRYATLWVYGLPDVIILNDLTGRLKTTFDLGAALPSS